MRQTKEQKYKDILCKIKSFLSDFMPKEKQEEVEKEYFLRIEQDVEQLTGLNEDGIINIEIYEQVRHIFKIIIIYLEEREFQEQFRHVKYIIQDLYYIFRYVYENILFLIENEFLVDN